MTALHILFASTSGHTEYVIDVLCQYLAKHAPEISIERQRAELAKPEDLLRGDVVILGSGTWNTGGIEGQLNIYMHVLLRDRAKDLHLQSKPITFISLGDDRYYFRTRCTEHFLRFQREHNGTLFIPPLVIVNEPYDQDEKICKWGAKLMEKILSDTPTQTQFSHPSSHHFSLCKKSS